MVPRHHFKAPGHPTPTGTIATRALEIEAFGAPEKPRNVRGVSGVDAFGTNPVDGVPTWTKCILIFEMVCRFADWFQREHGILEAWGKLEAGVG